MKRLLIPILLAAVLAACTSTAPPPPAHVTPQGDDRFLIDPRTGLTETVAPAVARQFDAAWRFFLSGNTAEARKRFDELQVKNPGYTAAELAEAAIEIREGNYAAAREILRDVEPSRASMFYEAEIAWREQDLRRARELYSALARETDPLVTERLAAIENALFQELYSTAQTAADAEAVRLLGEALQIEPGASEARVLLVQKLIAQKQYDEARRQLDPFITGGAVDRNEVQEALAEIDAGRGRYEEAIARYERLARRSTEPRYQTRLGEIKEQWNAANMPPQFQAAMTSEAITRADLAVLLYWKVPSIRFAQNVGAPMIATDISDVAGREEMIRAIALGIFQVDPVTRRVSPFRPVTAAGVTRMAARVLVMRGAACAKTVATEGDELARAQKVLAACNVTGVSLADPEAPVSGVGVARMLEQVNTAIGG